MVGHLQQSATSSLVPWSCEDGSYFVVGPARCISFFSLQGFYFLLNLWEAPGNAVILFFGCLERSEGMRLLHIRGVPLEDKLDR